MRRRKADLRARVNGHLTLRYERAGLTSYAGLEFVRRWLQRDGLARAAAARAGDDAAADRLRRARAGARGPRAAAQRRAPAAPSALPRRDPLVLRLCGLRQLPTARTVGRWLAAFRAPHLPRLQRVNALVAARAIRQTGPAAADDRRRRLGGLDGLAGRVGAARLQSASPQGAELLPDHGLRGAERAGAAGAESAGQRPRRQGGLPFLRALLDQLRATLGAATRSNSAWMAPFSAARSSPCSSGPGPSTRSRCPSTRGSGCRSRSGRRAPGRGSPRA